MRCIVCGNEGSLCFLVATRRIGRHPCRFRDFLLQGFDFRCLGKHIILHSAQERQGLLTVCRQRQQFGFQVFLDCLGFFHVVQRSGDGGFQLGLGLIFHGLDFCPAFLPDGFGQRLRIFQLDTQASDFRLQRVALQLQHSDLLVALGNQVTQFGVLPVLFGHRRF